MIRKTFMYTLMLCLSVTFLSAQSLLQKVPTDATFVLTLNPGTLNSKVKFEKLKEYDIYQMGMSQMSKGGGKQIVEIINDPAKYGMDLMASSHFFGKMNEKGGSFGMLMKLTDAAKFTQLLKDQMGMPDDAIESKGAFKMIQKNNMAMAWSKDMAFVGGTELNWDASVDYETMQKMKTEATNNWISQVLDGAAGGSILKNAKYMLAKNKSKDDAHLWMDYQTFMKMYTGMVSGMGVGAEQEMMMNMMQDLYEEMYISAGLNFDKGTVRINYDAHMNDRMMKLTKDVTDAEFNKNFLKYIPQEDMMGYVAFNYNPRALVEGTREIMTPMLNQVPMYGGMINDGMDILGIIVDEDALYDLWSGDMMLAVTGLQEYEKEITTYEYDEEFNETAVTKTIKQPFPEFTVMFSYTNQDNLMKIVRMGERTPFMINKGGYFEVKVPDAPMDFYMALHEGVFFLTNDQDLVKNRLASGYGKSERLSKAHTNRIVNNAQVIYWDIPSTLKSAAAMGVPMEGPGGQAVNIGKNSLESVIMEVPKVTGDWVSQQMSLNFKDKQMNGLEQLFKISNELFLSVMGGSGKSM